MDKRSTKEELHARLTEIKSRQNELHQEYDGQMFPEAQYNEFNDLTAEKKEIQATIAQLAKREEILLEAAGDVNRTDKAPMFNTRRPGVVTGEDIYDLSTIRGNAMNPGEMKAEMKDRAYRAIEVMRFPHENANREDCQAHVERLLDTVQGDQSALSKRILATASPTYGKAFGKSLRGQQLNAAEFQALSLGTDSAGGFAVPVQLDPTIIPTSDGSVNPYRQIARVEHIAGVKTWEGVTAADISAHRVAENTEAGDDSPTLAQPTLKPTRVQVFIPFSVELEQDWSSMQSELAMLIQFAKDNEEAASFTTGDGTGSNPTGVVTGATTTVSTAGTATFASGDLDALENALGARFRSRAQFLGTRAIYNKIRHFADDAGPDLWVRIAEPLAQGGNIGHTLLGYPANETTTGATTVASNNKILVFGDFSKYLIVDRIGLQMELVPHLLGTTSNYPTGQRGFYCWWRNNATVLVPNAFRTLKVL